jgi:predicted tellurium resistance membrane protein TerC
MADVLISLLTLTLMEIVLGIDNIIFITILCGKLPPGERDRVRKIGLLLALGMRLALLAAISWIANLTTPLFTIDVFGFVKGISGRDLILLLGGIFLVGKATHELHDKLEASHESRAGKAVLASAAKILVQIMFLDLVFSLDSVITAIGMANHLWVMMTAVVISIGAMLVFSGGIGRFVERHPTVKILALSFLLLIGVTLVAEGWGSHVSKGYIYFAMAFSLFVETLNIRFHKVHEKPVELHQRFEPAEISKALAEADAKTTS